MESVLDKIRCPKCFARLGVEGAQKPALRCPTCCHVYLIVEGIPVLLPKADFLEEKGQPPEVMDFPADSPDSYKKRQMDYYSGKEGNDDWWFEIDRPHNSGRAVEFITYYPMEELKKKVSLGSILNGSTLLNVGCGTGLEAEYFSKFGCEIIGIDFSLSQLRGAKKRMEKRGFYMHLLAADIENVPLCSDSVDFALAYESLHHLPDPYKGYREMCRVARRGVIVFEPRGSFLRNIALRIGAATEREVVGNVVKEVCEETLASMGREYGFEPVYIGRHVYKEFFRPPAFFALFDKALGFWLFRCAFGMIQLFAVRFVSNKLTFCAMRKKN